MGVSFSKLKSLLLLITLKEHFVSEAACTFGNEVDPLGIERFPPPVAKTIKYRQRATPGHGRCTVTLQVISPGPTNGSMLIEICRKANDQVTLAVEGSKGCLAGFAMIPINEPATAAEELERCVKMLGSVGTLVNNHEKGSFYYDTFFWPIFSKC